MSDRDSFAPEGCFIVLVLIVGTIIAIGYFSVYTIIILFAGSCLLTFIAGIVTLLYFSLSLPDVRPVGKNILFPVSSLEMFKPCNKKILHEIICSAALDTAVFMCLGKRSMKKEDIFVLGQKKNARQPFLTGCFGFIFLKVPLAGYYLVRTIFFGMPRNLLTDNNSDGPLKNDFVKGNILCVALTYILLFIIAIIRFIISLLSLIIFGTMHFLFYWPRKKTHLNHTFYKHALKCKCGQIHSNLSPSIAGGGVFFQKCVCGQNFFILIRKTNTNIKTICPICKGDIK